MSKGNRYLVSLLVLSLSSLAGFRLHDIPHVFGSVTELAASHAGTKTVVADRDRVVLEFVGEVITALGHGADEHANALVWLQTLDVVARPDHLGFEGQRDLAAIGRQVVGDGVLDNLEQLLLRVGGADRQPVQQLYHETGESLEGTGNADCRADFNQDALGGMDIDLQLAGFVDR